MGSAVGGQGVVQTDGRTSGAADVPPSLVTAYGETDAALCDLARSIAAARRRLGGHLDGALFANPGLDILMFLFAEGVNGATVTTNACCAAAGVPRTTALRWVKLMQDRGLIDGSDDVSDRRVTMLALTDKARDIVRLWLTEISELPLKAANDPIYR